MKKWQKQQAGRQNYHRSAPIKNRDASVMVKDTWTVVEEMDSPRLGKLSLPSLAVVLLGLAGSQVKRETRDNKTILPCIALLRILTRMTEYCP